MTLLEPLRQGACIEQGPLEPARLYIFTRKEKYTGMGIKGHHVLCRRPLSGGMTDSVLHAYQHVFLCKSLKSGMGREQGGMVAVITFY